MLSDDLSFDSDSDISTSSVSSSCSGGGDGVDLHNCCSISGRPSIDDLLLLRLSTTAFNRPHRSSDLPYEAIRAAAAKKGSDPLSLRDFVIHRRVGGGDIGAVYLCRLADGLGVSGSSSSSFPYAMKVVDVEAAAAKGKAERAETERMILGRLDHPFLPTLYARFDAPRYSCLVTEFCPGGDLHSLRHRQPGKRFSIDAARFYVAEVLLALEYLHMLGIIYRDLKPENVLIRSDGHIMLSDFDLSLQSHSIPTVDSLDLDDAPDPTTCLPLSRLLMRRRRQTRRRFVAEPVAARSGSFVGTHEYVAPEVASGGCHGAGVDWWALGVFLYELIHGRTPFAGPTNRDTLRNIVRRTLAFPDMTDSPDYAAAKDLIIGLLSKDPKTRLGSEGGAADVKSHPFFKGINLALVRSYKPPFVPNLVVRSRTERREPDRFDFF
ncbi:Protein kinase PINOID [Acorus calamus]|uniref:non-specific serine/threonine protein kinase n=1 Tax=Acorus calamus TaxID=4465 RepID=A0AAV9E4J1_ACOCL|nr:Protein kinase PINOID [Acorus calamus]